MVEIVIPLEIRIENQVFTLMAGVGIRPADDVAKLLIFFGFTMS